MACAAAMGLRLCGRLAGPLLAACLVACGEPTNPDSFGGPTGFSRVVGTVTRANGAPAEPGMSVWLARCESPIGGLAGQSETRGGGSYEIIGALPPITEPPIQDSMVLPREVIAGTDVAFSGPVDVTFYPTGRPDTLEALVVNLREN